MMINEERVPYRPLTRQRKSKYSDATADETVLSMLSRLVWAAPPVFD
jgi:hypothetical protein